MGSEMCIRDSQTSVQCTVQYGRARKRRKAGGEREPAELGGGSMSLTRLAFLNVWRREALCIYLLPGAISVASSIVRPARWPPWQAPTSDESASNGMPREMSARRADYVAWTESAASAAASKATSSPASSLTIEPCKTVDEQLGEIIGALRKLKHDKNFLAKIFERRDRELWPRDLLVAYMPSKRAGKRRCLLYTSPSPRDS